MQHDAPADQEAWQEHCRQTIEAALHAHRPQVPVTERGVAGRGLTAPVGAGWRPACCCGSVTQGDRQVLSADGGARFLGGPFLDPKSADLVLFLAEFKIIFKSI